ncbi:MAG: undecaprenyl-diphosphate phosphatase [Erysipelotrichaceae bacterium]|nr:undecaprenyl-diphosphate phosphatase [Erysipelotrichaceae bacterium]MDD3809537.1 undecaprenyl-diphosphate phosphatase [Erysipelotrichaceae bacterium]
MLEMFKVVLLGIVEGITEWLPISSTGHMILVDEFVKLNCTDEFLSMFLVVIQLGAIMAVVALYFSKLMPLTRHEGKIKLIPSKLRLWSKILVASLPAALIGLAFDDLIEEKLFNPLVVALTLIVYGVAFIVIEYYNKDREVRINDLKQMDYKTALGIGVFQILALIPGTSRSGATIIGGILLGTSREIAAEFTFYLAIPIMFGASLLKIFKFGLAFTLAEATMLLIGCAVAFVVSIFAIKFLMGYIKKHDFSVFGYYRILVGALVLIYFFLVK